MLDSRDRIAVLALLATDFLARTSYGLCRTPLLPLWAASLGASPGDIGLVGAAATLTGLFLKFPAGAAADVFGRGPLLLAGLLVFASAPFLYPLAAGIFSLVALRAFHGLATAVYGPASMAAAAALAKERRGEVLSWLSNTKIAGSLLGAFFGGVVLTGAITTKVSLETRLDPSRFRFAWQLAMALGAVALVVGIVVLLRSAAAGGGAGKKGGWSKFKKGLKETATNRSLIAVSATEGLQNVSVGILEQFLPIYAVVVAGLTPFHAGVLFAIQTISTIVAKPLFGRLSDRHGRRGLLVAGLWACAIPFAFLPWTASFPLLLVTAFVFGIGEALVTATAAALATDVANDEGMGAVMGAFGMIGDAGHAAGPLLGGFLLGVLGFSGAEGDPHAATAFRACFFIVAAAMALAAVMVVSAKPRARALAARDANSSIQGEGT